MKHTYPVSHPIEELVTAATISLNEAHQLLLQDLGKKAPAFDTLKSWRKKGLLDSAVDPDLPADAKRKFRKDILLRICKARMAARAQVPRNELSDARQENAPPHSSSSGRSTLPADRAEGFDALQLLLQPLTEQLRELNDRLAALETSRTTPPTALPEDLVKALSQLDAVRKHMMTRLDSELTALKDKTREPAAAAGGGVEILDAHMIIGRLNRIQQGVQVLLDRGSSQA